VFNRIYNLRDFRDKPGWTVFVRHADVQRRILGYESVAFLFCPHGAGIPGKVPDAFELSRCRRSRDFSKNRIKTMRNNLKIGLFRYRSRHLLAAVRGTRSTAHRRYVDGSPLEQDGGKSPILASSTRPKALEAGHAPFRQRDVVDLCVTTYALSSTVYPWFGAPKVPVIILNLASVLSITKSPTKWATAPR